MARIAFGMFDWIDHSGVPTPQLYEERFQLIAAAERAGFFGYHLAEHHGTALGMAPSPAVFLAAVAQRTSRIRFGPLAFLVPLYEPLRLAEEICMLDNLSNGRLELGLSRGVSPHELACFGVDAAGTRPIFDEALEIVRRALTEPVLDFEGRFFKYRDVPMPSKPVQKPYPPMWYPTHNPDSVEYAARHGYHYAGLGPAKVLRQLMDRYRDAWERHRHDDGRINGHVKNPILGTMRQIFIADTEAEAQAAGRAAYAVFYRNITELWHRRQDAGVDQLFDLEGGLALGTILIGTAAQVRDQLVQQVEESSINYLGASFAWGSLTHAQSMRSLELFVNDVMPALA
ncbi:MAG: LLM class flavin-dependent oxidoreductase [Gammaproteobacteria bacterium]